MDHQKRLRIGFFVDRFFPAMDDVVLVVDQYARHLEKVADVYVFAPKDKDRTFQDQYPYTVIRSQYILFPFTDYPLSLPLLDIKFQKKLLELNLDIVHIHSPYVMGKKGIVYAKKRGIPVIGTLYSQFQKDVFESTKSKVLTELAEKDIVRIFNQCDELWAMNPKIAEAYHTNNPDKTPMVMENATDLTPVNDQKSLGVLRLEYKIKSQEKVFIYVGKFDEKNNLDFLLESLYTLRLKGFPFKMMFLGSGPYEDHLKKSIKKYGLSDHILFIGDITDRQKIACHYAISDLVLNPTLYDSSLLVHIDAASQKIPTLLMEDASNASLIKHKVNGYLSKLDPKLYAETIMLIFKQPKVHLQVKETVFKDFYKHWDVVSQQILRRYQSMIKKELD